MKIINIFLKYNKFNEEDNNKDIDVLLTSLNCLFINKDNFKDLKRHIKIIIRQEKLLFQYEKQQNKINGKNYPYFSTKYLNLYNSNIPNDENDLENNTHEYIVKIYYIPKHFDMKEQILIEDNINNNFHEISYYQEKFQLFYKDCQKLYSNNSYMNQSLNTKKEYFEYFELEKELIILKQILKQLNNLKHIKSMKNIYSDMIVGEINYELENFNNNKEVIAQTIYVKDNKLLRIINSFIKSKFTNIFLKLLEENKNHQNTIFKDILRTYEIIKNNTYFNKEKNFIPKARLFSYLKESHNKELYKKNNRLMQLLNELLLNNVTYDNKYNYKRQTIPLDKVWEKRVFEYAKDNYIFNYEEFSEQTNKIFRKETFNKIEIKSISKPDLESKNYLIDSKYKIFDEFYLKGNSEDINKLIRDLIVFNKKEGFLVLIKKEGTNNKYEIREENIGDLKIKILEIDFYSNT